MEHKEMIDKINREWNEFKATLAQGDAERKQFGSMLGATEAKLAQINERIDAFEVKMQRQPSAQERKDAQVANPVHTKAFGTFLRKGSAALSADERKFMTVADDTTGGFGATEEFDSEIIKGITLISPVRQLVRVRTTGARSFKFMKRTGQFAAARVGERATRTETTGLAYGLEEIPVHELYAMVDISRADLDDTGFDLEGELRMEFAEQFAKKEGTEFITGTGANGQMEGIQTNADVATDEVSGGALTYDGLVAVSHNGKAGYDWRFLFNRKTLGVLRKMKDSQNNPIWAPMAVGAPATILGLPYTEVPDVADVATNAYPVFCGDFKRGFVMGDRTQLVIVRDDITQQENGAVRFWAWKRNGGQVVLAEAIRRIKITA